MYLWVIFRASILNQKASLFDKKELDGKKFRSLRTQIVFWFLLLSIIPLALIGYFSYNQTVTGLVKASEHELIATSEVTEAFIQNWLSSRADQLSVQADSTNTKEFLNNLSFGLATSEIPADEYVGSFNWTIRSNTFESDILKLQQSYEHIHDILLIDVRGNILFTVAKEPDLGKNLFQTSLSETQLAESVELVLTQNEVAFSGIERYEPSNDKLASFISAPVTNELDELIGVLTYQMNLDEIFNVISLTKKDSSSLSHYLITEYGQLLTPIQGNWDEVLIRNIFTNSYQNSITELQKIRLKEIDPSEQAVEYIGPNGELVIGVHRKMSMMNQSWVLISEIDKSEALSSIQNLGRILITLMVILSAIVTLIAFYVSKQIVEPLGELSSLAQRAASGESKLRSENKQNNEIGRLAFSFNNMMDAREDYEKEIIAARETAEKILDRLDQQRFALDQHAIVAMTDIKGNITYANKQFEDITGYSNDELIGSNHRIINSGIHPKSFFTDMYKTIANGKVWRGEICNRNKAGGLYWVSTTIVPFKNSEGKPVSYISIRSDITKQKVDELKLKEHRDQLEMVLDSTAIGIWDMNLMTGRIDCSERWFNIAGYKKSDFDNFNIETWKDFIHPMDLVTAMQDLERYMAGEIDQYHVELRIQDVNKQWIWCVDSGKIVEKTEEGVPMRIIGTTLDISRNKQAELEIKKALSLAEAILESTDNGISVTSGLNMVTSNSRFHEIWDVPTQKNLGESEILEFVGTQVQDPDTFIKRVTEILDEPEGSFNDILHLKNGKILERVTNPMNIDAETKGRVWSFRDITDREIILSELKDAIDQAEAAVVAKNEFLASMSHEIRTPMNGVIGMLGLLQNSKLTDDQRRRCEIAESSAKALLNVINDILDFSKVEAGKMELEWLDFNLRQMLGEFAESMAIQAQAKGLELILDLTGVESTLVKGDSARVRQIITNLVGNAIKFTSEGEVVIRAKLEEQPDGQLMFECGISDTGIGIPSDKIKGLFDSFSQVDASTTRKYGGTGLGLAIVRQLCKLMGGDVTARSEYGEGSTFTATLYLNKSEQATLVMPDFDVSKLNVLVVDDNATNREVICEQLRRWNVTSFEASNADEAIDACYHRVNNNEDIFDVAILDMQMPKISGAELGKTLKSEPKFEDMKLVMMTSMSEDRDAQKFSDLGFSAYFPKPTTTDDLMSALAVVGEDGDALHQASPLVTHDYLQTLNKFPEKTITWKSGSRILLVEDNQINQIVATGVLEEFEVQTDVAANGIEAINAIKKASFEEPYGLVLMDCQMPEMDGYEASRQIRQGKAGEENKGIPIVAMTANAMMGDREKCLDAGMNDYLSKPIEPDKLFTKLQQWMPKSADEKIIAARDAEPEKEQPDVLTEKDIWDSESALKRVRGKQKTLDAMIKLFISDMPGRIANIEQALSENNLEVLRHEAHTIKGTAGNLSALQLQSAAEFLEQHVKEGKEEGLDTLVEEVIRANKQLLSIFNNVEQKIEPLEDSTKITVAELKAKLFELKFQLAQGDFIDVEELKYLQGVDQDKSVIDEVAELMKQISRFENEQASATVVQLIKKLS